MVKKMTAAAFNKEYNLNNINSKWFERATNEDKEKKIVGSEVQTRKIWKDIIMRFFKNKWNYLFLIILVIFIIGIYIAKYLTNYSSTHPATNSGTQYISLLKPGWVDGYDTATISGVSKTSMDNGWVPWFNSNLGDTLPEAIKNSNDKYIISGNLTPDKFGLYNIKYTNWLAVSTPLGTDKTGRDVLTRLLFSASWSINLALIVATIETIIGVSIGIYLGYHVGKSADTIFMRFIEFFGAVPALLWMFIFSFVIGTTFWSMALVLILVGWIGPVYSARMFTMKMKDSEFILAAKATGASKKRILYSHVLPNIVGRLLVSFVHRIPAVIFFETTLVFLGFSVGDPSGNSIGNLINQARELDAVHSNITYVISISTFLVVLSVTLQIIANGIRDAFDPKVSGGR